MPSGTADFVELARERHGIEVEAHAFDEGTKTAEDAAAAIGCALAQIASSLVFVVGDDPVVVVTSGANRVDEDRLRDRFGVDEVRLADPDEVRSATGWSVGGVPPFCHDSDLEVLVDETLTDFETVWAAAGSADAVFPIDPDRLVAIAGGHVATVASPRS